MLANTASQGCTNLKLRRLGRQVARIYDADQRALGLKGTQYSLLSCVVKRGPSRPSDLARTLGLAASTLTRNLEPFVAAGWVVQEPGADKRSRVVRATDAGINLREAAQCAWQHSQRAVNAKLGDARVARLHALLDECIALLEDGEAHNDL